MWPVGLTCVGVGCVGGCGLECEVDVAMIAELRVGGVEVVNVGVKVVVVDFPSFAPCVTWCAGETQHPLFRSESSGSREEVRSRRSGGIRRDRLIDCSQAAAQNCRPTVVG